MVGLAGRPAPCIASHGGRLSARPDRLPRLRCQAHGTAGRSARARRIGSDGISRRSGAARRRRRGQNVDGARTFRAARIFPLPGASWPRNQHCTGRHLRPAAAAIGAESVVRRGSGRGGRSGRGTGGRAMARPTRRRGAHAALWGRATHRRGHRTGAPRSAARSCCAARHHRQGSQAARGTAAGTGALRHRILLVALPLPAGPR